MSTGAHQRVAILVDTANLYHAARAQFSGRVDYRALLESVANGRPVARAIAFVSRAEDVDVSPFALALEAAGFEVRVRVLARRPDGSVRGSWNVGIALAAAAMAHKVDSVALVSGDGDFVDLLDHLRAHGCATEIHAIDGHASRQLLNTADRTAHIGPELMLSR